MFVADFVVNVSEPTEGRSLVDIYFLMYFLTSIQYSLFIVCRRSTLNIDLHCGINCEGPLNKFCILYYSICTSRGWSALSGG